MADAAENANAYLADVSVGLFLLEICSQLTKQCQGVPGKTKVDGSPVTQADLAVQAIVTLYLQVLDSNMRLVAEEDASECMSDPGILAEVTILVNQFFPFNVIERSDKFSSEEVLSALKSGNADPSNDQVCWVLDPIDGTRGFVQGEQYAIALGKIVDGELVMSVVSCPNIPAGEYCENCKLNEDENYYAPPKVGSDQQDCWIVAAVKGEGCREARFELGQIETTWEKMTKASVSSKTSLFDFRFCESINYPPETQAKAARVAASLPTPTYRLDGMAKYCLVATGNLEAYLRFSAAGRQKIWDHVGELLVREAGGEVSDIRGIHLNFTGPGIRLSHNAQIVVSNGACHEDLLEVSRTVLGIKK